MRLPDLGRASPRNSPNRLGLAASSTTNRRRLEYFSKDPIGFEAGDANLRRYVGNDPLNATDPSGLAEVEVDDDGTVSVVPESWWFGINRDSRSYIVGKLAEFTSPKGVKWHVIITKEFRDDVNGVPQPIILHYNRFEAEVDSTRIFKMSHGECVKYIYESGFSANKNQTWINRGSEEHQLLKYLQWSDFAKALADGREFVAQEIVWTAGTLGTGTLLSKLRYLRHGSKARSSGFLRACFLPGTQVGTEQGRQPIERIKRGTDVWTYNHDSSEWKLSQVESLLVHEYDGDLVTLSIDEEEIEVTGGHPFWVVDGDDLQNREQSQENAELSATSSGCWIDAKDLRTGDSFLARDGRLLRLSAVSSRPFRGAVYNLSIASIHNYTVGVHGLLVHNKSLPNTGRWGSGSLDSALDSLNYHYKRHGAEVGAKDAAQYLRKAEAFAQNLRGARKSAVPGATAGVTRYKKLGKYIDIDADGKIISFGRQ